MKDGISFVVPVHNGAACVEEALVALVVEAAEYSDASGRSVEIIVVDDESRDGSRAILRQLAGVHELRIVAGKGLGAAAAINTGIRAARFPLIAQVDQDVVLKTGWLRELAAEFEAAGVGAAQGCYVPDPNAAFFARATSFELADRYATIGGGDTDHVCTGNSIYRADALHRIGLCDESLGYGYDNDVSYRLQAAGYRLKFCRGARSLHRWREGLAGYLGQQYGFGYGRADLVAKHPSRFTGDAVSRASMMWHPLGLALSLLFLASALVAAASGGAWQPFAVSAAVLVGALMLERVAAGIRAARRFRNAIPLAFPVLH